MNAQQIQAFQQAAGTKVASLNYSIKLLVFFVASVWVTWILTNVYQSLKERDVAFNIGTILRKVFSGLIIFTVILIILN